MSWAIEIEPGLWQGDCPQTPADTARFQTVVTVSDDAQPPAPRPYRWVDKGIPDVDPGPNAVWIADLAATMRYAPEPVLVHCKMGLSRSSLAMVVVLIDRHGWSIEEAVAALRAKHPRANLHPAYLDRVREWLALAR